MNVAVVGIASTTWVPGGSSVTLTLTRQRIRGPVGSRNNVNVTSAPSATSKPLGMLSQTLFVGSAAGAGSLSATATVAEPGVPTV